MNKWTQSKAKCIYFNVSLSLYKKRKKKKKLIQNQRYNKKRKRLYHEEDFMIFIQIDSNQNQRWSPSIKQFIMNACIHKLIYINIGIYHRINIDQRMNMEQKAQIRPFGNHFSFSQRFFDKILPNLNSEVLSLIESGYMTFQLNKGLVRVLNQMRSIKHEFIGFSRPQQQTPQCYQMQTLKIISHIQFTSLKSISLSDNHIYSIEGIAHFNMEIVTWMHIEKNMITSLKPLNKTNFSQLQSLFLAQNKFIQSDLSRARMNKTGLNLQIFHSRELRDPKVQNPYSVMKIQSNKFMVYSTNKSSNRIQTSNTKQIINKRFQNPPFLD